MKAIVEKEKLIRIIRRRFNYSYEQVCKIIDEYGAAYFNKQSDLNIAYLGYGKYAVTI